MGDSADNIPGVPGVGKVTAAKWLASYGTLENLYAHIDEIKGKARENLENGRESALLSRRLATLRTDLKLPVDIEAIDTSRPDTDAAAVIFRREEIRKFGTSKNFKPAETEKPSLFSAFKGRRRRRFCFRYGNDGIGHSFCRTDRLLAGG